MVVESVSPVISCTEQDCKSIFETEKSLRNHVNNYHQVKYTISFQGDKERIYLRLERKDGSLACPYCKNSFKTLSGIRMHLDRGKGTCAKDQEDPSCFNLDDEICNVEHIPLPTCPTYDESLPPPPDSTRRHSFTEAIIHACQSMESSDEEQSKNEWIITKMQLEPIALIEDNDSTQKAEFNAITHSSNAKRMAGKRFICEPIMQSKLKLHESHHHSEIATTTLAHLLHSSPLRPILMQRQYFELNDQVCQMLNTDWEHVPQNKYACAQVLAGCILLSEKSGYAVLVNTVEVYGRGRSVDIHREMSNQDGSIPPPSSYYENVWPCLLNTRDGSKLTIGTQTMNALVTSTVRLDVKEEPKVGPTACTVNMKSKTIRIFIDHGSWQKAVKLSTNIKTRQLEQFNLTNQLRQIRSQFHHPSSYYLIRASSFLATPFSCQPLSVFTFSNHENKSGSKGDSLDKASIVASKLFSHIAHQVLSSTEPSLSKAHVSQLASQCSRGSVKVVMDSILDSFGDADDILILYNHDLDYNLTQLASLLSSDISSANKTYVVPNIQRRLVSLIDDE